MSRRHAQDLVFDPLGRLVDGAACHHGGARRIGAFAVRHEAGVAEVDDHVAVRNVEDVGADLGKRGGLIESCATPLADDYDQRYQPYTPPEDSRAREFNVSEVRTNAVMRWEFRPGSTLFLVWAHGRQNDERPYSDRSWMYDYRDLFDLHPDNTLLVKVAYWLNR